MNRIRAMMRTRIQNVKTKTIQVRPLDNGNSDSKNDIESEHLKTYRAMWNLIDGLANIVGFSALKEMEMNYRLIFTSSLIVFGFFILFYTMAVVWPSVPTLLEVVCIFGVLVPVLLIQN